MRIQSSTDNAIRILQYLHINNKGVRTAAVISEAIGITYPFFIKIANQLKKNGLLHAEHGRNGGYRLGRPAEQISVYDVLVCTEGEIAISRCFQANHICTQGELQHCLLRDFFCCIQEQLVSQMTQQNIADLVA
ncbi:MAG: Rrf2 family transcriptional regulator [Oscillospiraceae bacterium]|nr:Rrf2 family transcriptional regulator [Oscillospiraceae bacterium]